MTHKGSVPLETNRLILRRFTAADDLPMFKNWCADPDVTKYLMWKTHESIEETRRVLTNIWLSHYDEPDFYQWAIVNKDINEPIGSIGVVKQDAQIKMVHIGYCIGKAWWRKGYVTEALLRIVRFFFEDVGVNRIESRHDPRNPNSGKVMRKAGLRYEGTSLESDWNNQGICDAANYALLAKDYFRKPQPAITVEPSYRLADITDINVVTDLTYELYNPMLELERDELLEENRFILGENKDKFILAFAENKPIGIAHVSLRNDYVNGTELGGTCGYLEAVYVKPEYRLNGIAAALVRLCEKWAQENGCREFASDCLLHNSESYRFHLRIGFTETERCIFFRKDIGNEDDNNA